jgi:hypothetical protein
MAVDSVLRRPDGRSAVSESDTAKEGLGAFQDAPRPTCLSVTGDFQGPDLPPDGQSALVCPGRHRKDRGGGQAPAAAPGPQYLEEITEVQTFNAMKRQRRPKSEPDHDPEYNPAPYDLDAQAALFEIAKAALRPTHPRPEGAPKRSNNDTDDTQPIALPGVWQSRPMSIQEADRLSWFAYEEMLRDPAGQKMVADMLKIACAPDALLGAAFMAGVAVVLTNPGNFRPSNSLIPPTPGAGNN